jgi:hypothetical protein
MTSINLSDMKAFLTITILFLPFIIAAQTTYHVGPGQAYGSIGAVPWESLVAGDSVIIYWRAQPYREKWVMARQGTANQLIVVHGVPNGSHDLPVIDAVDATTRTQLNFWNEGRGVVKVGGSNIPDQTPEYMVIENLKIMNGREGYTFTGRDGLTAYAANCAAVYIETGNHITIRNCELFNCGNGLFASSAAEEILVEGCYIHGNGNVGSIYEHNNYTEAKNITFQYNRFGPLCEDCLGNNLKDRSAGTVIRYNWIEGGNRQLDLVNADGTDLYLLPAYKETWVYGNILIEPDGAGNSQIVHYGGDVGSEDTYRKGTLYFYNNTVVSYRTGNTTLFRCSTNDETVDCRNNIVYVTESANRLAISNSDGTINLSHNWMKEGWMDSHGTLNGAVNDDGTTVSTAPPGFVDEADKEFSLLQDSPCRDAATDIPPGGSLTYEYVKYQQFQTRQVNGPLDIGAFEYVDGSNERPVVSAGNDTTITLPVDSVRLRGTAADPDGSIVTAYWRQSDGPVTASLVNPDGYEVTASGLSAQGIYEFFFTATDDAGASVADTMVVTVLPDTATAVAVNKTLSGEILIYPVPAQNTLHLKNIEVFSDLKIINLTGQILHHEKINSRHELQIDIARLPAGIFYIILDAADNRAIKRFVKAK